MKIAVPKESAAGEKRVALVPETVKKLAAKNIQTLVETGAGAAACFSDAEYEAAGATIAASAAALAGADTLIKIIRPSEQELAALPAGRALVCLQYPLTSAEF